ncbi:hypothetical protein FB451DRAFT_1186326 [Mycena latifolia]|nr:hypothetical protein FB451DRAFT_1186326 [Mycena latifolia]
MRYASYLSILILGATPASADVWGCPDTDNNGVPLQNSVLIVGGRTMQCYYGVAAMAGPEVCTYDLTVGILRQSRRALMVFIYFGKGRKFTRRRFLMSSPRQAVHGYAIPNAISIFPTSPSVSARTTFQLRDDACRHLGSRQYIPYIPRCQPGRDTDWQFFWSDENHSRGRNLQYNCQTIIFGADSVRTQTFVDGTEAHPIQRRESALTGGSVATSPGSATSISSGASSPGPSSGGEAPPAPVNGEHGASTPASKIAGITVGIAALVGLLIALLVYIRRRYTPIRALLHPKFHLELSTQRSILPVAVPEKDQAATSRRRRTVERDTASTISSQAAEIRQEYLRNRIRAAQRELDAILADSPLHSDAERSGENEETTLEEASQGNEAFRERISVLESQLQSQWALGLSDEPPPGYLE